MKVELSCFFAIERKREIKVLIIIYRKREAVVQLLHHHQQHQGKQMMCPLQQAAVRGHRIAFWGPFQNGVSVLFAVSQRHQVQALQKQELGQKQEQELEQEQEVVF